MDLLIHFNQIRDFLLPYADIWRTEILMGYPDPFKHYQTDWIEALKTLSMEDLCRLEKKDYQGIALPDDFAQLFMMHDRLVSFIPKVVNESKVDYDHHSFLKVKPKKVHEIKILAPFIEENFKKYQCHEIIDIGGGVGLLAHTLANNFLLPVTSIDADSQMQKTGHLRNLDNQKPHSRLVHYIHSFIDGKNQDLISAFQKENLVVGLHTCGELALHQFNLAIEHQLKVMINLGCCYHKLHKLKDGEGFNLSTVAKKNPLPWTEFALTLATRGHRKLTLQDYHFKHRVKEFRYTLHMFLADEFGIHDFQTLGNTDEETYQKDFATYAKINLKKINLEVHDDNKLNLYFADKKRQDLIKGMTLSSIIRGLFGRPLEVSLLLDRALWLEESGYETKIVELFNEELSPRNLGLLAVRKN